MKKLTIMVPEDLLRRARRATKTGATPTVRKGLELLAAREAYEHLRSLRGRFKFGLSLEELRED